MHVTCNSVRFQQFRFGASIELVNRRNISNRTMVTSVRSEREKTKYSKCKTFGFKRKFRKNLFCLYYEYFIVYSMENTSFFPSRLQFSVSQLYKYIDSKSEKQLSRSISLDNAPLNRFQSRIHRFTIDNLIKSQLTFFFFQEMFYHT